MSEQSSRYKHRCCTYRLLLGWIWARQAGFKTKTVLMCESVISSSRAMQDLQTGPHWCESVAPSSVTLEQRGCQTGHAEGPGCDGYLWGRVTTSGQGTLEGGGHWESPPSPCSHKEPLFLQGSLLPPCPPIPHPTCLPTTEPHSASGKRTICCCLQSSHQALLVLNKVAQAIQLSIIQSILFTSANSLRGYSFWFYISTSVNSCWGAVAWKVV